MATPNWLSSLQLRLIAAFALALALALGGVGAYVGYTARQATERFERDVEWTEAARLERLVAGHYGPAGDWEGLQAGIEQAGSLYGMEIVVRDESGAVVADSRNRVHRQHVVRCQSSVPRRRRVHRQRRY